MADQPPVEGRLQAASAPGSGRLVYGPTVAVFTAVPMVGLEHALDFESAAFLRAVGMALLASSQPTGPVDAVAVAVFGGRVEVTVAGAASMEVRHGGRTTAMDPSSVHTWIASRFDLPVTVETPNAGEADLRPAALGVSGASAVRIQVPSPTVSGRSETISARRYVLIDAGGVAYEVEGPTVLGRRPGPGMEIDGLHAVPVTLAGPSLSRTHAVCLPDEEALLVRDLDSTNGTVAELDGEIRSVDHQGWTPVHPGEILVLGATRLEVRSVD